MSDEIEKYLEADTMYQTICIIKIVTILLVLKELEFETNIFSKNNTPRLPVVFLTLYTFSINKTRICKLVWVNKQVGLLASSYCNDSITHTKA